MRSGGSDNDGDDSLGQVLLDEILVDTYGEDEQLWALRQAFEDAVSLPMEALVVGEPVTVLDVDYDGNTRRGLTARCRAADAGEHVVTAWEVSFTPGSVGALHVAAYRIWMGIEPIASAGSAAGTRPRQSKRHKAAPDELDLAQPVELVVLAARDRTARCRALGSEREITLRCVDVWELVPGEVVTVEARKQWRYGGHPHLSGEIVGHRLDVGGLGLQPLRLLDEWLWDPAEEYWGEEDEPLEEWARAIVARGPRASFEMEQVNPGQDPEDWDDDPILRASDLHAAGEFGEARKALMDVLAEDLRCLDAHAHLGNFAFDQRVGDALRHYEVGVRIGELSLGEDFDGVLPWIRVDNRPFLRCMHGYGLCLWRLGRPAEAAAVFERLLWLNPTDNQGVRALLPGARAGAPWDERLESPW